MAICWAFSLSSSIGDARLAPDRIAVEQRQKRDSLAHRLQARRHRMRDQAAKRPAQQVVRPGGWIFRMMLQIVRRHVVDRLRMHVAIGKVARLQTVDRMIGGDVPDQLRIGPAEAARIVDAEQRPLGADRPDRQQHLEIGTRRTPRHQALGQRLDGRRLEQAADADLDVEAGAHAADQADRQQRVPAKLEEVVVDADAVEAEDFREQAAQHLFLRRARCAALGGDTNSGAGNARWSSLPFGVSGRRSSVTIADGTMWSGSCAWRCIRTAGTSKFLAAGTT